MKRKRRSRKRSKRSKRGKKEGKTIKTEWRWEAYLQHEWRPGFCHRRTSFVWQKRKEYDKRKKSTIRGRRSAALWVETEGNRRIQFKHIKLFPMSSWAIDWANEPTNKRSRAQLSALAKRAGQSVQCEARKWLSGTSEWASERAVEWKAKHYASISNVFIPKVRRCAAAWVFCFFDYRLCH